MKYVQLVIELPDELAAEAELLQREEPSFLAHIVEWALARRHVLLQVSAERARRARVLEEAAAAERKVLEEEQAFADSIESELHPEELRRHTRPF